MGDALKGIGAMASAQLASRAVTFGMNVLTARLAAPSSYGITYVSFQLFSNLSLFLPKEAFRKVALRSEEGEDGAGAGAAARRSSLNLAWGGALCTAAASLPLAAYWATTQPASAPPTYVLGVALMAAASMVEGLAEPFLVSALLAFDYGGRAWGEAAALMARTALMCLLTVVHGDLILAFSASQLLFGLVWLLWLRRRVDGETAALLPTKGEDGAYLLPAHRELLMQFSGMAALKLLLTEGEKVLLLACFSEKDWGVFGLVSNLGSIILRLLFAPVEEVAYSAFTASKEAKGQWELLRALLLIQGGVGWLGACFGPGFSRLAVRLLYGADWAASEAPSVLAVYCLLLFCMAINGILEAFMYARCTPEWVSRCRGAQLATSLVLVAGAWLGRTRGPSALVLANSAAMLCRVALCVVFVRNNLALSASDVRAGPVLQMMALLALAGALCSLCVPAIVPGQPLPFLRAAAAIGLAVTAIAAVGLLFRHELRGALRAVRLQKRA